MNNVEQTPNPSSLQPNNLMARIVAVVSGIFFVVVGLVAIIIFEELSTLTCQRVQPTQGSCQFVHSRLLGSYDKTIPLNQLQSAKVDVSTSSKGGSGYRVVLLTDGGEVPFTIASSSGAEEKQENADRINAFIANPGKTSLRVEQDDRWSAYFFGGMFILLGGIGILSSLCVPKKG
jgi:hypothetical protein